jgi:hypothetical protein
MSAAGQLDQPGAELVVETVRRRSLTVAVHQRTGALNPIAGQQPTRLAQRQLEQLGRLRRGQRPGQHMVEHMQPSLRSWIHRDRLPRLHVGEGEKFAGRLTGDRIAGRPHYPGKPLTGSGCAP